MLVHYTTQYCAYLRDRYTFFGNQASDKNNCKLKQKKGVSKRDDVLEWSRQAGSIVTIQST